MNIEEIDKNFVIKYGGQEEIGLRYFDIPCSEMHLYGVFYETDRFMRMPKAVAKTVSNRVEALSEHTAGGRLRFSTDSSTFQITVSYDRLTLMTNMSPLAANGFALVEEGRSSSKLVKVLPPSFTDEKGYTIKIELPGDKMRNYILYFPLYNCVTGLRIGLDENARVGSGKNYRNVPPILYYGSSITQGGCVGRSDNSYQALISKWNQIDFINLGFSGSAKGEEEMAEYLATVKSSMFVCDYDYNAPTAAYLEKTHYRIYKRYREAHPETPILFLSKPDYGRAADDAIREREIRNTYNKAKNAGDKNVHFLEGKTLFEEEDRDNCTVDGCHPNDLGFYRMAQKIYKKMIAIDKKFR